MTTRNPTGPRRIGGRQLGMLLRKLAALVERSSAEELDVLLHGGGKLRIEESGLAPRWERLKPRFQARDEARFTKLTEELDSERLRSQGYRLLEREFPTKVSIEQYVRFLDLPVERTDTIASLRERIVESRIGARLRTEAIQGKRLVSEN